MRIKKLAVAISIALPANQVMAENNILVEDTLFQQAEAIYEPDEIHMSPTGDAGEALRNIPGVSGIRMGGRGIDPIIRGQSQNRLNILIDGAYVHGGCPNRMDPPTAYNGVDKFENITVIKGAQSVIYGGGGSGGTVLLEREKPKFSTDKPYSGAFTAGYKDNANSFETSIDVATGSDKAYIRGMATYNDADNYEDGDGNTVSSAFTGKEASLIAGVNPDENSNLEFSYTANREEDILFAGATMDSPWTDNDLFQLKYTNESNLGPFSAFKAELYSSQVDHLMDNYTLRKKGNPAMFMRAPSTSDTIGGRIIGTLFHTAHTWKIGLDFQENTRNAEVYGGMSAAAANAQTTPSAILWPDAELKQAGIFAELDRPINNLNSVKAGLRFDHIKASISKADSTTTGMTPRAIYTANYVASPSTSTTENNIGGFVKLIHKLDDNASLYGSLSRSVRTADATERYIAKGDWIGNTNLDPEQHHQLEIGYQRQQANWDFDISIYYNDVNDYILRDRARGQTGILTNNDTSNIYRNVDARLYGFETGVNTRWSDNWSSIFTLAYVHAENTTDNRPLAQTPPLEATINLEYNSNNWRLGGLIRAQDKQTRDDQLSDQDVGETAGWATMDLFGSYMFNDEVTLSAGINNLFDLAYAYHVNRDSSAMSDPFSPLATQVNEPGREFWLKVKAEF